MKNRAGKGRSVQEAPVGSSLEAGIIGSNIDNIFSKQSLILGEDAHVYETLKITVANAVKPQDAIEEMWVRDIVDLMWEAQRLRTLKANILLISQKSALEQLLLSVEKREMFAVDDFQGIEVLAKGWLANDKRAVAEVQGILDTHSLSNDSIMAQALLDRLHEVERIDRMIASADARRNRAITELERRREMTMRRLRTSPADITDI